MKKINLKVDGMTCSACSNGLEKYLNKQNGIKAASVNLVMEVASVEYDEKVLNVQDIEKFIEKSGFKSLGKYVYVDEKKENNKEKIKFVIFTILSVFLMIFSCIKMFFKDTTLLILNNDEVYICLLFILTIPFLYYGKDIIKNGYKNLLHRIPNMDTLILIGILTSFIFSVYNMVLMLKGNEGKMDSIYFESVAFVIYFAKLGRYIDKASINKAKSAISKLVKITPDYAYLKEKSAVKKITIDEVKKGDILVARPGEKIAVDGVITSGMAHFDESFITGESKPTHKKENMEVIAGSINYDGVVEYRAEKIGKNTLISEIVKMITEASSSKMKVSSIADRVSSFFVPFVIITAIITFLVYLLIGDSLNNAVVTMVNILVVACPCSLGLATPLASVISEMILVNKGIVVKKSSALEEAKKVSCVFFDKTGTLTYGKMKISKIINYSSLEDKDVIIMLTSIEKNSSHPISKAFLDFAKENDIEVLESSDFENYVGVGIKGKVLGKEVFAGNEKILEKCELENKYIEDANKLEKEGCTVVYAIINGKIVSLIGITDILRKESIEIVQKLKKQNIKVGMLTGDSTEVANIISKKLDIDEVYSKCNPKEKVSVINRFIDDKEIVLMCGDGINDSVALCTANIGVSISEGTSIAASTSDVILTSNDLNKIDDLIKVSKQTVKNIKQNLFWAFFYNILMIPCAMGVFKSFGIVLNPMIASIAMMLSSFTVILNSLSLKLKIK